MKSFILSIVLFSGFNAFALQSCEDKVLSAIKSIAIVNGQSKQRVVHLKNLNSISTETDEYIVLSSDKGTKTDQIYSIIVTSNTCLVENIKLSLKFQY